MDSKDYLKSYGWTEGQPLQHGGLKKPLLVKHKKDTKGLGNLNNHGDGDAWWERLFDGQLKNMDTVVSKSSKTGGKTTIEFKMKSTAPVATSVDKKDSPLYKWFVKGEGLHGTLGDTETGKKKADCAVITSDIGGKKRKRESSDSPNKKSKSSDSKKLSKEEKKLKKKLKEEKKLKKEEKKLQKEAKKLQKEEKKLQKEAKKLEKKEKKSKKELKSV